MQIIKKILKLAFIAAIFTCVLPANAQKSSDREGSNPQKTERMKQKRHDLALAQAKLLASEMKLSETDSVKLVSTFMDYQSEIWALKPPRKAKKGAVRTDSDIDKEMQTRFEHAQKMLDLQKKYYKKYTKFLTPSQTEQVFEMERKMIKKLNNKKKPKSQKHLDAKKNRKSPSRD